MRQSFRRAGLLAMAALLALVGTVSLTGTASAARQPDNLIASTHVQACPSSSGCPVDTGNIPFPGGSTAVATYCFVGDFNLTYSNPSTARGGFVSRSLLANPGRQTAPCAERGTPVQVDSTAGQNVLDLHAGTFDASVNFGMAARNDRGGAWCYMPPDRVEWVLVYMNRIGRAGFIAASALDGVPNVPSCNDGF